MEEARRCWEAQSELATAQIKIPVRLRDTLLFEADYLPWYREIEGAPLAKEVRLSRCSSCQGVEEERIAGTTLVSIVYFVYFVDYSKPSTLGRVFCIAVACI